MLQGPILHEDSITKPDPYIVFTGPLEFPYPNINAKDIEEKIDSEFELYGFLIYFELVIAIAGTAALAFLRISGLQIIFAAISIALILTSCLFALASRVKFNARKQKIAVMSFFFSTLISCITLALYIAAAKSTDTLQWILGSQNDLGELDNRQRQAIFIVAIIAIPIQMLIGSYLVWNGRLLYQLMEDRKDLLLNSSVKSKASIVGSL